MRETQGQSVFFGLAQMAPTSLELISRVIWDTETDTDTDTDADAGCREDERIRCTDKMTR